ncbi:hypothetical protein [Cedecea sp. P7760]|jgi:hypothetical protein|uniref:hypothetical protein n=1 Tax=Cedecea sp. P7760 TaxID=2726983 RepID=UPI0015A0BCC3|nr:hypothetical protein [Cedecea sp. P7760]NWC62935.1 hypothetical protein [Cedecea sp. P7760]
MISLAKDYLCHIANTVFRSYMCPFNQVWDLKLLRALETGEIIHVDKHTITFASDGDVLAVWVANGWYSYAYLFQLNGEYVDENLRVRPRFRTMRLLRELEKTIRPVPVTKQVFYDRIGGSKEKDGGAVG